MWKNLRYPLSHLKWDNADPRWEKLEYYLSRVKEAGVNLVSHGDRERLVERHLLPSLEALEFIPESGSLLDIGSGGGFPAIPLAIVRPDLQVTMVESIERKASFLKRVSRETLLTNVKIVHGRIDQPTTQMLDIYDIVTERAAVDLPTMLEWTGQFMHSQSLWVLWKRRAWREEGDPAQWGAEFVAEKTLSDGGMIVVLKKNPSTSL